ncbi:Histone-lysine N-methyltransferase SETMAR [Eumeta japonica]|uniref:Histone-lysine N-methyltransferase SETMAR n=1 Tax=Eumeta variegata TaxID=151549 RepID=A0A4C1Y2Z9_EUMVA|nr:Histone-lysine N-methyltransferase SETMAR [Eumeta japonica]
MELLLRALYMQNKETANNVLFHQDNASARRSAVAVASFGDAGFEILEHPPYSPDFATCDFYLFPRSKEYAKEQRFEDDEAVVTAVHEFLEYSNACYGKVGKGRPKKPRADNIRGVLKKGQILSIRNRQARVIKIDGCRRKKKSRNQTVDPILFNIPHYCAESAVRRLCVRRNSFAFNGVWRAPSCRSAPIVRGVTYIRFLCPSVLVRLLFDFISRKWSGHNVLLYKDSPPSTLYRVSRWNNTVLRRRPILKVRWKWCAEVVNTTAARAQPSRS